MANSRLTHSVFSVQEIRLKPGVFYSKLNLSRYITVCHRLFLHIFVPNHCVCTKYYRIQCAR
jgi:hypothetical protein